jgi:hypothetical protein
MQTGSSGTLIGWKSGKTTFVPLWDRMDSVGTLYSDIMHLVAAQNVLSFILCLGHKVHIYLECDSVSPLV